MTARVRKSTKLLLFCLLPLFLWTCHRQKVEPCDDYRQAMRDFVIRISETARERDADFIVIPQNGIELVTLGNDADAELSAAYLAAIDGHGQEDLFYGYLNDNEPTPAFETNYLLSYLHRTQETGKCILATNYCFSPDNITDAQNLCEEEGFLSFVAQNRELNMIPRISPPHENAEDIVQLNDAQNFLYLINPESFKKRTDFINALSATHYDVIIMDLFFNDGTAFTAEEIEHLKRKANGGKRLVICYMSIGEAEDYRYYWQPSWNRRAPAWVKRENPSWEGNYKVCYWCQEWQNIICGPEDSYLNRILNAGFDGVYLDIIDAFEYFE